MKELVGALFYNALVYMDALAYVVGGQPGRNKLWPLQTILAFVGALIYYALVARPHNQAVIPRTSSGFCVLYQT